jgi:hypothetical protein
LIPNDGSLEFIIFLQTGSVTHYFEAYLINFLPNNDLAFTWYMPNFITSWVSEEITVQLFSKLNTNLLPIITPVSPVIPVKYIDITRAGPGSFKKLFDVQKRVVSHPKELSFEYVEECQSGFTIKLKFIGDATNIKISSSETNGFFKGLKVNETDFPIQLASHVKLQSVKIYRKSGFITVNLFKASNFQTFPTVCLNSFTPTIHDFEKQSIALGKQLTTSQRLVQSGSKEISSLSGTEMELYYIRENLLYMFLSAGKKEKFYTLSTKEDGICAIFLNHGLYFYPAPNDCMSSTPMVDVSFRFLEMSDWPIIRPLLNNSFRQIIVNKAEFSTIKKFMTFYEEHTFNKTVHEDVVKLGGSNIMKRACVFPLYANEMLKLSMNDGNMIKKKKLKNIRNEVMEMMNQAKDGDMSGISKMMDMLDLKGKLISSNR